MQTYTETATKDKSIKQNNQSGNILFVINFSQIQRIKKSITEAEAATRGVL